MSSNKTTGAAVPRLFCSNIYYIMGFQPQGFSASGVFGLRAKQSWHQARWRLVTGPLRGPE